MYNEGKKDIIGSPVEFPSWLHIVKWIQLQFYLGKNLQNGTTARCKNEVLIIYELQPRALRFTKHKMHTNLNKLESCPVTEKQQLKGVKDSTISLCLQIAMPRISCVPCTDQTAFSCAQTCIQI